jgi:hypothetical protein
VQIAYSQLSGNEVLKHLGVLIILLAISGCATKGIPASAAVSVGEEGQAVGEAFAPASGKEMVTVIRDVGFRGTGCVAEVLVDGEHVASLRAGQKADLHLSIGRHILGARPGGVAICRAQASRAQREIDIDVEAGRSMAYRIAIANGLSITPTTL